LNLIKKYTEDELTDALKMHDAQAFQYLYDNYKGALFTVIKSIITVNEIAEDVLQDAFTMAWKNIEKYDPAKGRLFTWLLNVTRNCAINTTRSKNYKSQQKNDSLEEYVTYADEKDTAGIKTDHIGLRNQMNTLRADYRNVLELCYFKGYTHEEISQILNIPSGTVKTRLRNALIELRKQF
jgi:RNA polymerase sigma factor (sigma-70 family)